MTSPVLAIDAALSRRRVRYIAAAISAATALIYLLIGLGAVSVVDEVTGEAPDLLTFGLAAGAAYALGTLLLVALDRRLLWVLGAILQVGVIVMYVAVAPSRTPSFELWGLTIKVLQVVLLGALAYLAIRPVEGPRADVAAAR